MPSVIVLLYGVYRDFAGGRRRVGVEAGSVGEAIDRLSESIPSLKERLRDEHGRLREHMNVYVGQEEIHRLDGERTTLADGDEVHLIPAISGGRGAGHRGSDRAMKAPVQEGDFR